MKRCALVFQTLVTASLMWFILAAYSIAAQWDPSVQFSITNGNPNGVWSYGWTTTTFTNFTLMPYSSAVEHGRLWGARTDGDLTPSIWFNDNFSSYQGVSQYNLALHPGPGNEPSIVRWTTPANIISRQIHINGAFLAGNYGVMLVGVRFNDSWQWQGTDSGAFDFTVSASAGDRVDFAVYGGYGAGATGLVATISTVSEPVTSGLKLWLKADSLSLADGQAVALWPDSSGNGLDVSQALEARKPMFKSSILNDKPVIRFGGSQDLSCQSVQGAAITGPTTATIFVVENQFSPDTQNSTLGWGNKGDNRLILHTAYANWLGMQHGNINASPDGDCAIYPVINWPDSFHIAEFHRNGGIYSVIVDGKEKSVCDRTGTPALDTAAIATLYIGSDQWENYLTGDIAEILVYDQALNSQEQAQVRQYLVDKYGFSNHVWGTDLNNSGRTDLVDFAEFARWWMNTDCMAPYWCANSDLNQNSQVDILDLYIFTNSWLNM
jgi:hypothetical protein